MASKKHKREILEVAAYYIKQWADKNQFSVKNYEHYVFRVSDGTFMVDIFPLSKKVHNLPKNEWGTYDDLQDFLASFYDFVSPDPVDVGIKVLQFRVRDAERMLEAAREELAAYEAKNSVQSV